MNTEQIIKDLESCINKHHENCCQLGSWHEEWNCMTHLMKRSLAIIKEVQAENEKLTINMNAYGLTVKNLAEEIDKLKAQNETLEIYNKDYKYRNKELQGANEGLAKNCEELEIVGDELRERIENLKRENKYLRESLADERKHKEDMEGQ